VNNLLQPKLLQIAQLVRFTPTQVSNSVSMQIGDDLTDIESIKFDWTEQMMVMMVLD
jgi:hypothetical protein